MKTKKTDSLVVLRGVRTWLSRRMMLAYRCEANAAKRGDHAGALRFEHEHNALSPVMNKLMDELTAAKRRDKT